jgi:hypothetical protein
MELASIELDAGPSQDLAEKQTSGKVAHRKTVGFGDFVDMVGRYQMSCAGHILYDDRRISWDMAPHVPGNDSRIGIESTSGRGPDNEPYRLTLVVRLLCRNWRSSRE